MRPIRRGAAAALAVWLFLPSLGAERRAQALSGPSPSAASAQTVKLPDAPGSVQGLSDAASISVFSGQIAYSVPISLPAGPAGFGPTLSLTYLGELGNGPVGIGWTVGAIAIRRSLRHGVPSYTDADELELTGIGDPGRLVPVGADEYRVEGQGNRIRVTRRGTRFDVLSPDGVRYALGVTASSRQEDAGRIAAWYADSAIDVAGQQVTFSYDNDQNQVYLDRVTWGAGGAYQVDLVYDGRTDQVVSYRTGFAVKTARRLVRIDVFTAFSSPRSRLRSYRLSYDDQVTPDQRLPVSRLATLQMFGTDDTAALPTLTFTYARPELAAVASPAGTAGWVLNQRGVSFVDVDGDGADDLLRLEAGNHAYLPNLGNRFGDPISISGASDVDLEGGQLADLDGDARPELVRIVDDTWRYYRLDGGNWVAQGLWSGTRGVPLRDPATVLCDVNADGRVDIVRGATNGILVYLGTQGGLLPPRLLPPISAADSAVEPGKANVRFVDVNGDGVVDVVWLTDAWMKIFLGRGDGTFALYNRVFYPWGQGAFDVNTLHFADLNRDGLMDVVLISGGYVYWYPGDIGGQLSRNVRHVNRPENTDADAVVQVADANGNGSPDLVWSSPRGMWVLDLAGPTSAGMLSAIDNGVGKRTEFSYRASDTLAVEAAAQGSPWTHKLPVVVPVVIRQQIDPGAGGLLRVQHFGVRDGFWDGAERRLGGFLQATETVEDLDGPLDTLFEETQFHPGLGDDRVLRGHATVARRLDGRGNLFTTTKTDWQAIAPSSASGGSPLLRRAVTVQVETAYAEGVAAARITRTTWSELDAEARPTVEQRLGLVDVAGDEKIVRRSFADDDTFWVRERLVQETVTDASGSIASSTRTFYGAQQGAALPLGQVGQGYVREIDQLLQETGRWIAQTTRDYESCGNPQHIYEGGVHRTIGYDASTRCLHPTQETVDPGGGAAPLLWQLQWDERLAAPRELVDPNGDRITVGYDSLVRQTTLSVNGRSPHVHHAYDWTAPRPSTTVWVFDGTTTDLAAEGPTWPAGAHWRPTTSVFDGAGEALYEVTPLGTRFIASGWKEYDERGQVIRAAEPFFSDVARPSSPPAGTRIEAMDYDAQRRLRRQTLPNGAVKDIVYRALGQTTTSSELGPVTSELDGQLRIAHTERDPGNGTLETIDGQYDAADRITALRLQGGAVVHAFTYDTLGRLTHATDPDVGDRQMVYDDRNYLVQHTNGVGQSVFFGYDDAGRLTSRGEGPTFDAARDYAYSYDLDSAALNAGCHVAARLASVQQPTGEVRYCYDELGREAARGETITVADAPAASGSRGAVLSLSGLLLQEIFDDGFATSYHYDPAGRVDSVTSDGVVLWSADLLDAAGRVLTEHYGNGVAGGYEHDALGLPSRVKFERPTGGGVLYDAMVTRNAFGAPTQIADNDGDQGLDENATFDYDGAGRLTQATLGTGAQQFRFTYAYDALQNMTFRGASGPKDIGVLAGVYRYGERGYGPRQLTSVVAGSAP